MSGEFFPKPFSPAETSALERKIEPQGQAVNDIHECISALILCLKSAVCYIQPVFVCLSLCLSLSVSVSVSPLSLCLSLSLSLCLSLP